MLSLAASFPRYNHKNKDGNHESLAKTDWQLSSREQTNSTDVAEKCAKSLRQKPVKPFTLKVRRQLTQQDVERIFFL